MALTYIFEVLYSKAKGLLARLGAMIEVLVSALTGEEINPSDMEISERSMKISIMLLMDVLMAQSSELKHNFQNDNLHVLFVNIIVLELFSQNFQISS